MIDFYKKRKIFFSISLIIILIGIVALFINGINLDIQFKGGVIIKYNYTGEIETAKVEDVVSNTLGRNVSVQITNDLKANSNNLVLNLAGNEGISPEDQNLLDLKLKENFNNDLSMVEAKIVEPFIGARFLNKAILALIISSILIVLYVWVRFKKISGLSAGVMALIALLHDCLVVFFAFVIFKLPINETFIAVLLTIIGYSINDTIIIYDRIRENKTIMKRPTIEDLTNKSITQSMTRSINTACTTFVSAIILLVFAYIFNIDSIVAFAFPMSIGLVSGCYSTICIAGPLWVMWQKHKLKGVK